MSSPITAAGRDAEFSIVYDGEAVADGTIDTKDLAPALLAFAELIEEARSHVPDAPSDVSLRVRAGFERGSFEVTLELAHLYQQVVAMFSGPEASAWSNLLQIIGISGGLGLFQLVGAPVTESQLRLPLSTRRP